eukprot:282017_1
MATLLNSVKMLIKIDPKRASIATHCQQHVNASVQCNRPSTPHSPITPTPIHVAHHDETHPTAPNETYSVESRLKQQGHIPVLRLAKTLQGAIWKVSSTDASDDTYIAKVTSRSLHKKHIAYIDGKPYSIKENIVQEAGLLRYLTLGCKTPPPVSLVQYIDCFCDSCNYFLIMEDGGNSLFEFIKQCHSLIKAQTISIQQWHSFCKTAMKQMVDVMHWLHNECNVCHLDVSLENFVIKNMKPTVVLHRNAHGSSIGSMELNNDFQIKLIDFGVAEVFTSKNANGQIDFRCKKYVGKTGYKAPKVYGKKHTFDARSADCWSLAVCFFMMVCVVLRMCAILNELLVMCFCTSSLDAVRITSHPNPIYYLHLS